VSSELPSRDFTALPPPPSGALVAVREGRGIRRRRRLVEAGAAAASLGLALGVLAAAGTGTTHARDELVPAVLPTSQASPTIAPADPPEASLPGPRRTPSTPPLVREYRTAPPPSTPSTSSGPSATVCGPAVEGSHTGDVQPTTDWCEGVAADTSARGHDLTIRVCRGQTAGRLTFAHTLEAELEVLSGETTVWRWSTGHPDVVQRHTLEVAAGACWSWTAAWTDVDARGARLRPGTYTLRVSSRADEVHALMPRTKSFEIR
jgi:hypothetical protein